MPRTAVLQLLTLGAVAFGSTRAAADSIRCDGGIVATGDSRLDLFAKCGPPALQEAEPILATAAVDLTLLVERWTYNFGAQRFIQIVTLKAGKVIAVETGSYGYELSEPPRDAPNDGATIPRARCESDAIRIGDRTFDVLAKCGEPAYRDLRRPRAPVEVWTYDFGKRSFVRYLEFENGRLTRIRTGSYGYSK